MCHPEIGKVILARTSVHCPHYRTKWHKLFAGQKCHYNLNISTNDVFKNPRSIFCNGKCPLGWFYVLQKKKNATFYELLDDVCRE